MALEDLTRYENAILAGRFAMSELDQQYVPSALKGLADSLDEDARDSTNIALDLGGAERIIDLYSRKYNKVLESANMSDLSNHYSQIIENYLEPALANKVKGEFGRFSNKTYGDINKELKKAKHIISGEDTYEYPKSEKEWAKHIIEEYKSIKTIMAVLEADKTEKLRAKFTGKAHKDALKGLAEKLNSRE
ncbi:MAG: hypothetical protein KKF48_01720 [Nanoarchaeota archaeon]|nr:hypothetical protein [Nanoarchaeota archaeon]MBU1027739.1 hypothetical protein [Nanoarchaeota archaeon]